MDTPEHGARTSLYCATSPEVAGESGQYYDACRRKEPAPAATAALGAELWRRSGDWTAAHINAG